MIRAELDALPVSEANSSLEYRSLTGNSHLCGHDGHCAVLAGALLLTLDHAEEIPSDCAVRFLFQPAEEKGAGAALMIEKGALEGVSEAWALHNTPFEPEGGVFGRAGPISAGSIRVTLQYSEGKEGGDPLLALCEVNVLINERMNEIFGEENDRSVIFTFLKFSEENDESRNPRVASMGGSCRFLKSSLEEPFVELLKKTCDEVAKKRGVEPKLTLVSGYPIIVNNDQLIKDLGNVVEVIDKYFPMPMGDDFSYYALKVPGCYFSFGTGKGPNNHSEGYDFKDQFIERASRLWFRVISNQLRENSAISSN